MRLTLTRRGDYAVRLALELARMDGRQTTGPELAGLTGVPSAFLPQVIGDLVRAGIVANRRGRHGGYRLGRPPEDVSLLDVVEAVEGDGRRTTCVMRGGACRQGGVCEVHDAFLRAQETLYDSLAHVALADLVRGAR
jgi:Rrf2 family protein